MNKVKYILTFLLSSMLSAGWAQMQNGIVAENGAGVMGITLNPANTNYYNNGTDIMLLNYSVHAMNNGLYMNPKPVTNLLSPDVFRAFSDNESTKSENMTETFDRVFDVKRDLQRKNYIFADVTLYGPSFLTNYKKHSFGITTSFKSASSSVNLPPEIVTFLLKGVGAADIQGKTVKMGNMSSGSMVYWDLGFNYSYEIVNSYKSQQRLGATLHYIRGINSLIYDERGSSTWEFIGDSTIYMRNGNFDYNYAATKSSDIGELMQGRGRGFSIDLGYTYVRKLRSRPTRLTVCPNIRFGGKIREFQSYKWKLGVSVMDIGKVTFNYQSNANHYVNAQGEIKNLDLAFYGGLFALDRAFRYSVGDPGLHLFETDNFVHYMPMRVNLQFDYYYKRNIYFNLNASQRIEFGSSNFMHAPNIISGSVRYETHKYSIGLPVSLIEYQYPILGLNFRVGPFYMGTNHLTEVIGLRKIKGVDLYFGFKYNISNFRGV